MPWHSGRQPERSYDGNGELYLRRLIAEQERDARNNDDYNIDIKAVDDDNDAPFVSVETAVSILTILSRIPRILPMVIRFTAQTNLLKASNVCVCVCVCH